MKELSPLETFDDLVFKISTSIAKDYPCAEQEDVSQHLFLTILEHRDKFKHPDNAGVTSALWKIGKAFALQVRAEALHVSVQYAYRTEDVKKILEHTFEYSQWHDTEVPEDAESIKAAADELDLQSDIKWAWSQLTLEDRKVVFRRFALKDDFTPTETRRCNRAVEKLVTIVNTYPRPGHPRRAMRNSRAQHVIGGTYE